MENAAAEVDDWVGLEGPSALPVLFPRAEAETLAERPPFTKS